MLGVSELGLSCCEAESWERWDEVLVGFGSMRLDQAMRKRGGLDSRMERTMFGLGLECIWMDSLGPGMLWGDRAATSSQLKILGFFRLLKS